MSVGHAVIKRYQASVGSSGMDLRSELFGQRPLIIHLDAVDRRVLAKRHARGEAGIGRRVGQIGNRLARPLEQRADEIDAPGRTDGRDQQLRVHPESPIQAIGARKNLARFLRSQRVGVGIALAQIFGQRIGIIAPLGRVQSAQSISVDGP